MTNLSVVDHNEILLELAFTHNISGNVLFPEGKILDQLKEIDGNQAAVKLTANISEHELNVHYKIETIILPDLEQNTPGFRIGICTLGAFSIGGSVNKIKKENFAKHDAINLICGVGRESFASMARTLGIYPVAVEYGALPPLQYTKRAVKKMLDRGQIEIHWV